MQNVLAPSPDVEQKLGTENLRKGRAAGSLAEAEMCQKPNQSNLKANLEARSQHFRHAYTNLGMCV
eukprot:scaffold25088_cov14-Tisochrysis_lutea.AAC.1